MSEYRKIRATLLLAALLSLACATRSPGRQSFVSVQTPHFEIVSSFGEQRTLALARQLESFRAGVSRAIGAESVSRVGHAPRVRVLAFDDRSPTRPFARRAEAAYFLPTVEAGLLVIRASGAWGRRASRNLRRDYAQWLLRGRYAGRTPLWLEEGLAQFASTVEVRERRIRIGAPVQVHVNAIQDWPSSSLDWVLRTSDLSRTSDGQRARFEAYSWSLATILYLDTATQGLARGAFARALQRLASDPETQSGQRAIDALTAQAGERLAGRVVEYLKEGRFRVELIRPARIDEDALEARPVATERSLVALGSLALALDRPKLAQRHFQRAHVVNPVDAQALAGLALASVERFSEAEALARRADDLGSDDSLVQTWIGRMYALAASAADGEAQRKRRLMFARRYYSRSLELDEARVMPRFGMGLSYLVEGEDYQRSGEWLDAAARLRPGSLEIELARARLDARLGRNAAAREHARQVVSRSHSDELREQALAILDSLEGRRR